MEKIVESSLWVEAGRQASYRVFQYIDDIIGTLFSSMAAATSVDIGEEWYQ